MQLKSIKWFFVIQQHDHLFNKTSSEQTIFFNAKQANVKIILNSYILTMKGRTEQPAALNLKD